MIKLYNRKFVVKVLHFTEVNSHVLNQLPTICVILQIMT